KGIPRSHPDYYPVRVMSYILGGGGLSSRLPDAIRNERGLAYSVRASFSAGKYTGTFRISMQTKNKTAEEAIGIAIEEIRRIREQGVTEEELETAKTFLIGSFPLRLDTNRRIARFLARVEYLELGLDFPDRFPDLIRQVSREDVTRVARAHLHLEKLIVVMVANLDKVR
ncbi:MAG: M16 family metallopeptidase, partial [Candidatus Binatia bacterium]